MRIGGSARVEPLAWLLRGQGVFYVVTGVWPFVHLPTFVGGRWTQTRHM
jgi:hypothetical protein